MRRDYETRYCDKCKATTRFVKLGGYHVCMGDPKTHPNGCEGKRDGEDKGKVLHDKGDDEP